MKELQNFWSKAVREFRHSLVGLNAPSKPYVVEAPVNMDHHLNDEELPFAYQFRFGLCQRDAPQPYAPLDGSASQTKNVVGRYAKMVLLTVNAEKSASTQ